MQQTETPNIKQPLVVRVFSFSYKKGIPSDESGNGGGYVFDCRSIHNPGRYEPYKQLTGIDQPVIDFLEKDGEIISFLDAVYALADAHIARYMERGFTHLMFSLVARADNIEVSILHSIWRNIFTKNLVLRLCWNIANKAYSKLLLQNKLPRTSLLFICCDFVFSFSFFASV